jgi:hypothetical protein
VATNVGTSFFHPSIHPSIHPHHQHLESELLMSLDTMSAFHNMTIDMESDREHLPFVAYGTSSSFHIRTNAESDPTATINMESDRKLRVSREALEIESRRRKAVTDFCGGILLLFILVLPPLMDCSKPGVYAEDMVYTIKVISGISFFYLVFMTIAFLRSRSKLAFNIPFFLEQSTVLISFYLMLAILIAVQDRSRINIAQIVLTYSAPIVVIFLRHYITQKIR